MLYRKSGWMYRILLAVVCVGLLGLPVRAATPAEVDAALKKARDFIYSKQIDNTRWEPDNAGNGVEHTSHDPWAKGQGDAWGGWTALCTYALLASGESPQDPRIKNAIQFLLKADMIGIYAIGVRAQIWAMIPHTPETRRAATRDAELLLNSIHANGKSDDQRIGLYDYSIKYAGNGHNSPSQYGVLGMWAAEQAGIEVPNRYWMLVDTAWRRNQAANGGWSYQVPPGANGQGNPVIPSMTTAGIATLFITQDYLRSSDGLRCTGNITNPNIEAGLKWMTDNIDKVGDAYTWYGVERIGVASGLKYFGTVDWYQKGAEFFVRGQGGDGSWMTNGVGSLPLTDTAFGMLFLSRGRAPVVMNKLAYDIPNPKKAGEREQGNWNQRPRDVANLSKWIAKQTERDLNWQIVNLKVSVDDLHDAPILYVSGNEALNFTKEEEAKLKQYIEQGGIILGHADCGAAPFTQSFRKLGTKLFPSFEFRELPADHPIYTNQQYKRDKWRAKPSIIGLTNGVRELMLLVPQSDPAKAWQLREDKGREEFFQLGADIFLYSIDKQSLRNKGETYLVKSDPAIQPDRTIKLARLEYDGTWDPEPGGWRRLAAVMNNQYKTALDVQRVKLDAGKLDGFKIAHLTGSSKFVLKPAQRDELKKFVTSGGTLIVDAAGGNSEFIDSLETEMGTIFGESAGELKQPLPRDHAIYSIGGHKIEEFVYRSFARKTLGNMRQPQLRVIGQDKGRAGVIFSREDISTGLVGQPLDGVIGYDPKTATALMANILTYAYAPPAK